MKFYKRDPDRALSGMAELTLQERGAYNTIIDLLYARDGCLRDDDEMLRRLMGCHGNEWRAVKARLIAKGKIWVECGLLKARRVDDVLREAAEFSETQRKRAGKRWETAGKRPGNAEETSGKEPGNLEKTQSNQASADAKRGNALTPTPTPTPREEKNSDPKGSAAVAAFDPVKLVFEAGIRLLGQAGIEAGKARGIIGRWRKAHPDEAIIAALGAAQRAGAVDPVAYVGGALRGTGRGGRQGERRTVRDGQEWAEYGDALGGGPVVR